LEDESLDVVAAVFNAVDDQIGSSNTGATVKLAPENITAFKTGTTRGPQGWPARAADG